MLSREFLTDTFLVTGSLFFIGMVALMLCLWVTVAKETRTGTQYLDPYK